MTDQLDEVSEAPSLVELLEQTPPGPELAVVLASVDRSRLDCGGLLRLAAARQQQIAHDEAQLLADLHAVARTDPGEDGAQDPSARHEQRYPWAEAEAAMALRWTRGRAGGQMVLADEVIDRLPQLHAALEAGRLDIPKVLVFTTLLERVDTALARTLVDKVIDQAEGWTTAQLRQRLRRLLLAADPEAARKKAKRDIKERRVAAWLDDDSHLAYLSGQNLPPHRVAAIMERLDAVAKAAKAAGDERTPDQIRADVFLDVLTGEGIAVGGPITDGALGLLDPETASADAAAAESARVPPPTEPMPESGAQPPEREPATPPDPEGMRLEPVWSLWPPLPEEARDPGEADDPGEAGQGDGVGSPARRAAWLADFDRLPTQRPATWCVLCGHSSGGATGPGPMPGPRRGTVEVIASLDTLMGLADLPAEITGMGPVTADIARQVITQMRDAQWRYSIYDPLKHLLHHGTVTARPTGEGEYAHATSRFPSAEQAAWIRARDRVCVAPGCRRPARRCDVDHTLGWVNGGETVHCNMSLLCRGHHLLKHATGSELIQSAPGIFRWRTPAGMQYQTRSEPPLLLDPNQLAGIPKPRDHDADLTSDLAADLAALELADRDPPGAEHAVEPVGLSVDDILLPAEIDDPDHLPLPAWAAAVAERSADS